MKRGFILCSFILGTGCSDAQPAKVPGQAIARAPSPSVKQRYKAASLLVALPPSIELGEVPPGGCKYIDFSLMNPRKQSVEVTRIETSCPCLSMDMPSRLAPGEQVSIHAKLDLHDEPDFTGALGIEVEGWTREGELAFVTKVNVQVAGRSETHRPPSPGQHAIGGFVTTPERISFGRIHSPQSPLRLSFTITNQSQQPIAIAGIRSGCGCTIAEVSDPIIPPHGHIIVRIKLNLLGRLGKFANRVLVDVQGLAEPLIVPIEGLIIQDVWCNDPLIQCFIMDSAPVAEKTFEIRTVDWPHVQFDWHNLDKSISIEELSRTQQGDETIILFRLRMESSKDEATTTRHVTFDPVDKRIKPLTIPVICHRPLLLRDRSEVRGSDALQKAVPLLKPSRVCLGVISRNRQHRFLLYGPSDIIHSLKLSGIKNMIEGTKIELHPKKDGKQDALEVAICLAQSVSLGPFDGRICLVSPDGNNHPIEVFGIVGPNDPGRAPNKDRDKISTVQRATGE